MSKATVKESAKPKTSWWKRYKPSGSYLTDGVLEWASVIIITPALVVAVMSLENLPV